MQVESRMKCLKKTRPYREKKNESRAAASGVTAGEYRSEFIRVFQQLLCLGQQNLQAEPIDQEIGHSEPEF